MRKRALLKSQVRENRTPGYFDRYILSEACPELCRRVEGLSTGLCGGAPGNRRPYPDGHLLENQVMENVHVNKETGRHGLIIIYVQNDVGC